MSTRGEQVKAARRVGLLMHLLDLAADQTVLNRVLEIIAQAIRDADKSIARADEEEDAEFAAITIATECELVEDLLGIAFVTVQAHLTGLRKRVVDVSEGCEKAFGQPLSFGKNPLQVGNQLESTTMTAVEAMNAAANYWKHKEEWEIKITVEPEPNVLWDKGQTVALVQQLGMAPMSEGNLRQAATRLHVADLRDLSPIRQQVASWAREVVERTRSEVAALRGQAKVLPPEWRT